MHLAAALWAPEFVGEIGFLDAFPAEMPFAVGTVIHVAGDKIRATNALNFPHRGHLSPGDTCDTHWSSRKGLTVRSSAYSRWRYCVAGFTGVL